MADFLATIVARKREEVAARLNGHAIAAPPTRRSLAKALAEPGARFIMEVKKRSPSGHRSEISAEQAVAAYAPVADAISVLTDGPDFGGSLDDLRMVRDLFDGPILAKDFIVEPVQVSEARAAGADAVLVMMAVLDPSMAADVLAEAKRLNMDAIVEVHDEAELSRALQLGATLVGINNRDFSTLTTDLAVTERLAPLVPDDVLLVSESGIKNRHDVIRLSPHVDAFLVGSSLMAAPDIVEAARALVHGRVKLCGLTRTSDVALAARAGAIYAGFVLAPESPRAVGDGQAVILANAARDVGLKSVGVFRQASLERMAQLAHAAALDVVQLHSATDEAAIARLRKLLAPSTEIWAVRGVDKGIEPERGGVDRCLFDTNYKGACGGTGKSFNWDLLKDRSELPTAIVAGGINAANARAATELGAYGIDLCSGIEAAPGIKDETKVQALFAALRPRSRSRA